MGSGDQIGMDFGDVDLTPVETPIPPGPPEWVQWFRQMDARLTAFATETIPGLPQPIWSDAAMDRVEAVFADFFPDEGSVMAPENADIADQFVRWIGECYVHRFGDHWYCEPHFYARGATSNTGAGLYQNFGPAVRGGDNPETTFVVGILKSAAKEGFDKIRFLIG